MTLQTNSAAPGAFGAGSAPAPTAWPRAPRRLEAGRGAAWWSEGWRVFTASPVIWIAMIVVAFVAMIALGFVPVLGSIAQTLLYPVVGAGLMLGCHALARGQPLEFAHLIAGFRHPQFTNLILLGLIWLAVSIVIMLICLAVMAAVIGTAGVGAILGGDSMASMGAAMGLGMALVFLVPFAVVTFGLFLMAWWFAVPLVTLNGAKPVEALRASFAASWANIGALFVYGLIFIVLAIVASIPMGLGWLVLAPVATGASYASWREVFGD